MPTRALDLGRPAPGAPLLSAPAAHRAPAAAGSRSNGTAPLGIEPVRPRTHATLDTQTTALIFWTARKIAEDPGRYFLPELRSLDQATAAERDRNQRTVALYKETFKTFLWTGFECSNPRLGAQRWDQSRLAGFYDHRERQRQIRIMRDRLGVENARVGLPNHLIVRGSGGALTYDWSVFDAIHHDLERACGRGRIKTSLDILHFGLPDAFFGGEKERSGFLHPDWPAHFSDFATAAVDRYPAVDAITLINEPFVTNNFSGGHWNEAAAGDAAFIRRAFLMGKAAMLARMEIEARLEESGTRKVFLHNESCEYRSNDPDFDAHKRFLTSDLILGADWLFDQDLRVSDAYRWMIRAGAGDDIARELAEIRDLHRRFQDRFGKDAKSDTVFGIDYYVTCESGPGISHDPESYKKEAQKTRRGLYEMGREYWNRYRLPLFHAETNMREERAADWMTQQLIELAALMRSGAAVLGATWYSLMDQVGWENGLNGEVIDTLEAAEEKGRLNPIGLVSLRGHDPRASAKLVAELGGELARGPVRS